MGQHIELHRRFRGISIDSGTERAARESYEFLGESATQTWDDLLAHARVVILGEPGSGKTHELRHKAESLQREGHIAFYVHLDRLVSESLESALGRQDSERLRRWNRAGSEARFFVDSVDETKHIRQQDFLTALDRMRDALAGTLHRASIVLSCRISDWRPHTDAHEFESRLPIGVHLEHAKGGLTSRLHIVQIAPLDRDQVELYAKGRGIDSPHTFLQALDDRHAWTFARRPIDVDELILYWKENRGLGPLRELIEFDLKHKLRETQERDQTDPLTPEQARHGAMALGAAVALCRRFQFRVPDDSQAHDAEAMVPEDALPPDWRPALHKALLSRAVFDCATFGRIRFHHRRVAEYLAALWLEERMADGCPLRVLEGLLFDRSHDSPIARPSLAPVTAWLACGDRPWNQAIRLLIKNTAPELFLQHGDPECLPSSYKADLIREIIKNCGDRKRVWLDSEPEALARLADPSLTPLIRDLILDSAVPNDLRVLLLQIVRYGRLGGCLPAALQIIDDSAETDEIRHHAAAAVRDVGDHNHKTELAAISSGWAKVSPSLCGIVCQALYPEALEPSGLVAFLEKVEDPAQHADDVVWVLQQKFHESLPSHHQVPLLQCLLQLAQRHPHLRDGEFERPISAQFPWALRVAVPVLSPILQRDELDAEARRVAADALALLIESWYDLDLHYRPLDESLDDLTRKHPCLRQAFVWKRIDALRERHSGQCHRIGEVFHHHELIKPFIGDVVWLLADSRDRSNPHDRLQALSLAIDIWEDLGCPTAFRRRLARSANRDKNLKRQLRHRVPRPFAIHVRRLWFTRLRPHITRRSWQRRNFAARAFIDRQRENWLFMRNVSALRSGSRTDWLGQLALEAASEAGPHRWTATSWESLSKRRNPIIASAVRAGCKRSWTRFRPPLPHQRSIPNKIDIRVVVGLTGIAAALADGGLQLDVMSDEDARLATRYAVEEMNGFPQWLYELARHQPKPVREVLAECIRGEWVLPASRESVHEVVAALRYHATPLHSLVVDDLLAALEKCDPQHCDVLQDALAVLLYLPAPPRTLLAGLAAHRAPMCRLDEYSHTLWLSIWLQTDSAAALDYAEMRLSSAPNSEDCVVATCCALKGGHVSAPLLPEPSYLAPPFLRRFIPFVFRHVRPADDIVRSAGVAFSPASRDDAQSFRDRLLPQLAASQDPEADNALTELMDEPLLVHLRDWIIHLVHDRRQRFTDLAPWQPADVREFTRHHEHDPRSEHDLFDIAQRRLSDIRYAVEQAEVSARKDLRPEDPETSFRSWLARQLESTSRDRYSVHQEEEIDPGNPDLRLAAPGIAALPIEIKWADRWSGPQLFERLEHQLIGQYLRPHGVHYGVYVVGRQGGKRRWKHPNGLPDLSFSELVDALRSRATEVVENRPDIYAVEVIGIDFSPP